MQKDDIAAFIRIPSVFISFVAGEWLRQQLHFEVPWNPVRVSINTDGERAYSTQLRYFR